MTKELTTPQKIIVMKSGLPLFVSIDRAENLEQILAGGSGHRFVKIDEKTINSAEIEGIYSAEQYDELQKVKQGQWVCRFKVWHNRREECECKRTVDQKLGFVRRAAARIAAGEITDKFELEAIERNVEIDKKWLAERGVQI